MKFISYIGPKKHYWGLPIIIPDKIQRGGCALWVWVCAMIHHLFQTTFSNVVQSWPWPMSMTMLILLEWMMNQETTWSWLCLHTTTMRWRARVSGGHQVCSSLAAGHWATLWGGRRGNELIRGDHIYQGNTGHCGISLAHTTPAPDVSVSSGGQHSSSTSQLVCGCWCLGIDDIH